MSRAVGTHTCHPAAHGEAIIAARLGKLMTWESGTSSQLATERLFTGFDHVVRWITEARQAPPNAAPGRRQTDRGRAHLCPRSACVSEQRGSRYPYVKSKNKFHTDINFST
ncbi:hypothetical protein EVAR_8046_1 [Eumeta japonica]|uniref:Uncharacterized protein n=1 Tax=Eumeta variegata TaxID=151549 RepID=A0A4C1TH45_EUMVA|nr:hypothetical protein EVAR_8046_1 [Eumeta japonica]